MANTEGAVEYADVISPFPYLLVSSQHLNIICLCFYGLCWTDFELMLLASVG